MNLTVFFKKWFNSFIIFVTVNLFTEFELPGSTFLKTEQSF